MPILYYVPITHSVADQNPKFADRIKKSLVGRLGEVEFNNLEKKINEYWKIVEKRIHEEMSEIPGLIIYHDSIPVPVGDHQTVLEFFEREFHDCPQSPNLQLIKMLLDEGAILEGTEDINLLREHQSFYRRIAEIISPTEQDIHLINLLRLSKRITLKLRDEFIAKRIHDTLPESGRGILFMGRAHDVITELEKLSGKFRVVYL